MKGAWVGERLWINLASLGLQSLHSGNAIKKVEDNDADEISAEQQHKEYASLWLQHIALLDDMQSEHPGVKVRNIEGLAGVDYLSPGALTSFVSYVFGPVITALQKAGYSEGTNLDAAPYDWRLSPKTLEQRDKYFTRTMTQIETMYRTNNKMPVVLLCHSLGCKVGHYLLNFAKRERGQEWLDKHIHTYMPVGAPHLGAPTAIRSPVSGEKMGLEAFLSNDEALIFGRSLGSGPWLFPSQLPAGATTTALVRKQGSLTVELIGDMDVLPLLRGRKLEDRPDKVKLMVTFGSETLSSDFVIIDGSGRVTFNEKFIFATKADQPMNTKGKNKLIVAVREPGISVARKDEPEPKQNVFNCCLCWLKCLFLYCIWGPLLKLLGRGLTEAADAVAKASGGASHLGVSDEHNFIRKKGSYDLELRLFREKDANMMTSCRVKVTWEPWEDNVLRHQQVSKRSAIGEKHQISPVLTASNSHGDGYAEIAGHELMYREKLFRTVDFMDSVYNEDSLQPRGMSSTDAPPVQRVKAIYGINVPTEVGAIYKLHRCRVESPTGVKNYFKLDTSAKLSPGAGCVANNGIIWETEETVYNVKSVDGIINRVKRCGDGTVPYWSLQHAREWSAQCHVVIDEIVGATHREILADERFHEIVLRYITRTGSEQVENV